MPWFLGWNFEWPHFLLGHRNAHIVCISLLIRSHLFCISEFPSISLRKIGVPCLSVELVCPSRLPRRASVV